MVKLSFIEFYILSLLSQFLLGKSIEDANCKLKGCKESQIDLIENMICEMWKLEYNKSNCNQSTNETMVGPSLKIILKSNKHHILDNTSISPLIDYIETRTQYNEINLYFNSLKGFNIESTINLKIYNNNNTLKVYFHPIIDFYNRENKLLNHCDDFERIETNDFFINTNTKNFDLSFYLDNNKKVTEICELIFLNTKIRTIAIHFLTNSYFKTRLIRFENQSKVENLKSTIFIYELKDCNNIHLSRDIINEKIFNKTGLFNLLCDFKSIEDDIFRNFKKFSTIYIKPSQFTKICKRQGIKWIQNINSDISVNLSDPIGIFKNFTFIQRNYKIIWFSSERNAFFDSNFQIAYDEDFCLFKDLPFKQLVVFFFITEAKTKDMSCTTLWLIRLNSVILGPVYKKLNTIIKAHKEELLKCEFKIRLKRCNKSNFELHPNKSDFSILDFMILSEFLLIISSPIMSLIGIITNTIIILVIVKKENRKELKEKQYTYMAINSVSNIFICLIQILSLMNECQLPLGLYCSSIRHNVTVQYFKIVFGEYFNCFFRLFSNFTYVAFALNRLSLIGKDHNKLTKFVSKVGLKKYVAFSIFISASFPVVKAFRYIVNETSYFKDSPILYFKGRNGSWYYNTQPILLMIFNVIYDLVNYVLFVLFNLIIDLILVKKLKEAIKEREEKFKEQSDQAKEKLKKENEESMRRVIYMVIISSLLNFLLKLPIVITSLNDLRVLITSSFKAFSESSSFLYDQNYDNTFLLKFPYSMNYFCFMDKICMMFESFGSFLFLISLSVNFYFLRKFDKHFQSAYETVKRKNKKKS